MPDSNLFDVPAHAGQSVSATVPDTLDLADRAALALNGITGTIDPDLLTTWGLIHYNAPRPHLSHWASAETLVDPKLAESITLMRIMSGSTQGLELEQRYRGAILDRLQDGLYWDLVTPRRPWRNSYSEGFYGKGSNEDFATLPGAGRMLRTMLIWRELAVQPERMEAELRSLTGGLLRIAVRKGDYAYYPEHGGWGEPCAYPRSGWLNTEVAPERMHSRKVRSAEARRDWASWEASKGQMRSRSQSSSSRPSAWLRHRVWQACRWL